MKKEIIMPKIGLDMEEGTIEQWLKKVGDTVKEGDPLVEIETDKAVTTVESALNGTLVEIVAELGSTPVPAVHNAALRSHDGVSRIASGENLLYHHPGKGCDGDSEGVSRGQQLLG